MLHNADVKMDQLMYSLKSIRGFSSTHHLLCHAVKGPVLPNGGVYPTKGLLESFLPSNSESTCDRTLIYIILLVHCKCGTCSPTLANNYLCPQVFPRLTRSLDCESGDKAKINNQMCMRE